MVQAPKWTPKAKGSEYPSWEMGSEAALDKCSLTPLFLLFLVFAATSVIADTEVHRCLLEDGTFAFQETPCPDRAAETQDGSDTDTSHSESETPVVGDDVFDFVNPFDEPAGPPTPAESTIPEPLSTVRAECEEMARDAIDEIDLEMQANTYSKEQGQKYLAELLELTRQLRACKQL